MKEDRPLPRVLKSFEKDLQEVVERNFPQGDKAGKRAWLIFAEAMVNAVEIVKAFGGCENCYGKGYSTQMMGGGTAMGDFVGDEPVEIPAEIKIHFCTCGRGRALREICEGIQR